MTKEEWRNLTPGILVTLLPGQRSVQKECENHIYKVVSTGWEDMEEKDYEDDDYVIEVKEVFDCFDGQIVVRAHETALFNKDIPTDIFEAAKEAHNPYHYIREYFFVSGLLRGKRNFRKVWSIPNH